MFIKNAKHRWVAWGVIVAGLAGSPARALDDPPPALEAPVAGAASTVPNATPRGPAHEALKAGNAPGAAIRAPQPPPAPVTERPTSDRPFGDALWISGYWTWDVGLGDFVGVAGTWKVPPPGGFRGERSTGCATSRGGRVLPGTGALGKSDAASVKRRSQVGDRPDHRPRRLPTIQGPRQSRRLPRPRSLYAPRRSPRLGSRLSGA